MCNSLRNQESELLVECARHRRRDTLVPPPPFSSSLPFFLELQRKGQPMSCAGAPRSRPQACRQPTAGGGDERDHLLRAFSLFFFPLPLSLRKERADRPATGPRWTAPGVEQAALTLPPSFLFSSRCARKRGDMQAIFADKGPVASDALVFPFPFSLRTCHW